MVDQRLETTVPGLFACGNCLQVYDTVDLLSLDAKKAGEHAAVCCIKKQKQEIIKTGIKELNVLPGNCVRYVVPQRISTDGIVHFTLRVDRPQGPVLLRFTARKKELFKKIFLGVNPVSMISVDVEIPSEALMKGDDVEVNINDL